jgi:hypothetical protein
MLSCCFATPRVLPDGDINRSKVEDGTAPLVAANAAKERMLPAQPGPGSELSAGLLELQQLLGRAPTSDETDGSRLAALARLLAAKLLSVKPVTR